MNASMNAEMNEETARYWVNRRAAQLYTVYCDSVGWKAWGGEHLPTWGEFELDPGKTAQCAAWREVAKCALGMR